MMILALAGGGAYLTGRDGSPPLPATTSPTVPSPSISPADLTTSPEPTQPSTSLTSPVPAGPLMVVSGALEAWGSFAVSGDLATVEPWFSEEGPQWEQFEMEAPGLAADPLGEPPYSVVLEDHRISHYDGEVRVEGMVRFVRTGEPTQAFRWEIHLRDGADGWEIWTVEEVQPGS